MKSHNTTAQNLNKEDNIVRLRNHLRVIWKSYATSSHLIADILEPTKATYLINQNKNFHSAESAIYLYLIASQNFLRSTEKVILQLENEGLRNMKDTVDENYVTIKIARDIIEHFEDYAIGKGKLQKSNIVDIKDTHLSIKIDPQGQRIVHIFNLGNFNMGALDWNVDGLMHFIERRVHEYLLPDVPWQGWYPDKY